METRPSASSVLFEKSTCLVCQMGVALCVVGWFLAGVAGCWVLGGNAEFFLFAVGCCFASWVARGWVGAGFFADFFQVHGCYG